MSDMADWPAARSSAGAGNTWIKELVQSIDALLNEYGELAEDEVLRADMFEGHTEITEVLAWLVDKGQEADSYIDGIKGRLTDLHARKARLERRRDGIRRLIQGILERASLSKFQLPEATLSVSVRKPEPIITDEAALPMECQKVTVSPDMRAIKELVASGTMPPGVSMSNGRAILMIRSR